MKRIHFLSALYRLCTLSIPQNCLNKLQSICFFQESFFTHAYLTFCRDSFLRLMNQEKCYA